MGKGIAKLGIALGIVFLIAWVVAGNNDYEPIAIEAKAGTMQMHTTPNKEIIIWSDTEIETQPVTDDVQPETESETETEAPTELWYAYNNGNKCSVTYYCLCPKCCGKGWKKNICADGTTPERYVTCANGALPFGTKVYIDGIGYRWVHDRGSKVNGTHFDIYVGVQNHEFAKSFGKQYRKVWVVEEER